MPTLLPAGPKAPTTPNVTFGKYTIKASSRVIAKNGKDYIKIRGYHVDMSIVEKVENITRAKATNNDMSHTETQVEFLFRPVPYPDGVVFLDYLETDKTILVP